MLQRLLTACAVPLTDETPSDLGTADLRVIGRDSKGQRYAVKRLLDGPLLPVSEAVAAELAADLNIGTPGWVVVRCLDGQEAFGSIWKPADPGGILAILQRGRSESTARHFGAIYGLDLFIRNPDRHFGNYLNVGGVPLAFDHSRALWTADWPAPPPPFGFCRTVQISRKLNQVGLLNMESAQDVLRRIQSAPADWLLETLIRLPMSWREMLDVPSLDQWWREGRLGHCELLLQGIEDGPI